MNDELLNRRVLREITKAGQPFSCAEVSFALREHIYQFTYVPESLLQAFANESREAAA